MRTIRKSTGQQEPLPLMLFCRDNRHCYGPWWSRPVFPRTNIVLYRSHIRTLLARMEALKNDLEESTSVAQSRYKGDFDRNVRTITTFEVRQFVYVNRPPRVVLSFDADKSATASSTNPMPKISRPYLIVTVRENTLTVLQRWNRKWDLCSPCHARTEHHKE